MAEDKRQPFVVFFADFMGLSAFLLTAALRGQRFMAGRQANNSFGRDGWKKECCCWGISLCLEIPTPTTKVQAGPPNILESNFSGGVWMSRAFFSQNAWG